MGNGSVKVFLGIPTYNNWVSTGAMYGVLGACQAGGYVGKAPVPHCYPSSLLAKAFNALWLQAILEDADVFAMLHADIAPSAGWLDELVHSMHIRQADLVSANVRLKANSFEYSVAMDDDAGNLVRLNQAEIETLPDVFDRQDVARLFGFRRGNPLLVNTGCWVADLRKSWVRSVYFDVNSKITWYPKGANPQVRLSMEPEDYFLSRQLHKLGVTGVYGTRRVKTRHLGETFYDSDVRMADDLRAKLLERSHAKN